MSKPPNVKPYSWVLAYDESRSEYRWHHIENPEEKHVVLDASKIFLGWKEQVQK